MHHPGPPLFPEVGDWVELAPRDPDPDAEYRWRIATAPEGSSAEVGDGAVEYLHVDAPGTFVAELEAPDGRHHQTIRAFEGRPRDEEPPSGDAGAEAGEDERPDTVGPPPGVSGPEVGRSGDAAGRSGSDVGVSEERARDGYGERSGSDSGERAGSGSGERTSGSGSGAGSGGVLTGRRTDEDADAERHRSYAGADPGTFPEQAGEGGRPRIQLRGRVEGDSVLVEADPQPHPHGDEAASDLDVAFALDDRDDLEREDVEIEDTTLRIPLARLPERARVHAVSVGEHGPSVADSVDVHRAASDTDAAGARGEPDPASVAIERPYVPPSWADDVVIYEIYVRTFASDVEGESEFDAIAEKFDHLEELGVDVLWLTPVLENDHAPHGYNITDFYSIADDLGDREDYERFVERAHDRGFAVLFDLVCNHTARDHEFFRDAYGNPDSEYYDWYDWQDSGEPETYFDWEYIANFDFSNLEVRQHLLDAIDQWAPLVDGFRVDMAWAVPNGFWRELRERVKSRDSEFLLLDETIPYIPDFQAGLFDTHFDSTTYAMLRSVGTGWADASELLDAVDQRASVGFPDHAGFMLYQENHDESRYRVECGREASLASAGALCTLPGSPLIYAGQELGQLGKRDDVVWDHTDEALLDHYRHLTAARHRIPALEARADLERVDYDVSEGDASAVVAFRRRSPEAPGSSAGDVDDPRVAGDTTPVDVGADEPESVEDAVVVLNFAEDSVVVSIDDVAVSATDAVFGESIGTDDGLRVDSVAVLAAREE